MFATLAAFIYQRRWSTLVASTLFLAAAIAVVLHGGRLTGGSFGDGEAEQAQQLSAEVLGQRTDNTLTAVFHSDTLDPRQEPFKGAMKAALAPLAGHPHVLSVMTPDDAPFLLAPRMVNAKAGSAVAMVSIAGSFKEAISRYP